MFCKSTLKTLLFMTCIFGNADSCVLARMNRQGFTVRPVSQLLHLLLWFGRGCPGDPTRLEHERHAGHIPTGRPTKYACLSCVYAPAEPIPIITAVTVIVSASGRPPRQPGRQTSQNIYVWLGFGGEACCLGRSRKRVPSGGVGVLEGPKRGVGATEFGRRGKGRERGRILDPGQLVPHAGANSTRSNNSVYLCLPWAATLMSCVL